MVELRLAALEERAEALIGCGDLAAATAELGALIAAHPLRERLRELLMTTLYRTGRQADALTVFADARQLLDRELGIEPGPALRRLHLDILRGNLADAGSVPAGVSGPAFGSGPAAGPASVVPRQLPPAVRHFAGRTAALKALAGLLGADDGRPGAVPIAAVHGTAGVGKTALAVHFAHQVAGQFPDGQLYVDLRGFHPNASPMPTAEAVRGFLDAFEVPPGRVPGSPRAQADLYRSLLADRRVLVVLDNAATAEQVRPLLPGSANCLALVTSRAPLTSLVAVEGAQPLTLDVLGIDEAREQLANQLGRERLAGEARAVDEIVAWCAHLPLALAIVGARAASRPGYPLDALLCELRDARYRLDALTDSDVTADVRTVFSWSYHRLSPPAARLFGLLGLHPGPDIGVAAAASLADLPVSRVAPLLAELTRAHLLTERLPGRYACHDLLRAYAAERAREVEDCGQRDAAVHRLLDHYLHTAHAAAALLNPHRKPVRPVPAPRAGAVVAEDLTGYAQAMAWFATERPVLVAAVDLAADNGFNGHVPPLAWCMAIYFQRLGHWQEWAATQRAALKAATLLEDRCAAAHAHRDLARAYLPQGRFDNARRHLMCALDLFRAEADTHGEAQTHLNLGMHLERQGRHREALRHTQQAFELFRSLDNRIMQARALNAIGWLHAQLDDHRQAISHCREALVMLEPLDDRYGQAASLDSLGFAQAHLGQHDEAVASYQRALDIRRELGDRASQANVLTHLGDAHLAAGHPAAARDALREALALLDQLGLSTADGVRGRLASLDGTAAGG